MSARQLDPFFLGERLYGDDFTAEQIAEWHHDEMEAYAELGAKQRAAYRYSYHALNKLHGYDHLQDPAYERVLGLGSAYGDEFEPLADRIGHITVLEPSTAFAGNPRIFDVPCRYVAPLPDGTMPFADASFELITCFGVLHHVPNVSHVLKESARCLASGGSMLIREPIVSMGDWTRPRPGLTTRERGIPVGLFDKMISSSGLRTLRRAFCMFPAIPRAGAVLGVDAFNHRALTRLDACLSAMLRWNVKYHRTRFIQKISPSSIYYVLEK